MMNQRCYTWQASVRRRAKAAVILIAVLGFSGPQSENVSAQGGRPNAPQSHSKLAPVIYPNWGQSLKEQEKDKAECHDWAMEKSGLDPSAPVQATVLPALSESPAGVSPIGGMKTRDQVQREKALQEQYVTQQQGEIDQKRDYYKRAYGACAQARGYTVR